MGYSKKRAFLSSMSYSRKSSNSSNGSWESQIYSELIISMGGLDSQLASEVGEGPSCGTGSLICVVCANSR